MSYEEQNLVSSQGPKRPEYLEAEGLCVGPSLPLPISSESPFEPSSQYLPAPPKLEKPAERNSFFSQLWNNEVVLKVRETVGHNVTRVEETALSEYQKARQAYSYIAHTDAKNIGRDSVEYGARPMLAAVKEEVIEVGDRLADVAQQVFVAHEDQLDRLAKYVPYGKEILESAKEFVTPQLANRSVAPVVLSSVLVSSPLVSDELMSPYEEVMCGYGPVSQVPAGVSSMHRGGSQKMVEAPSNQQAYPQEGDAGFVGPIMPPEVREERRRIAELGGEVQPKPSSVPVREEARSEAEVVLSPTEEFVGPKFEKPEAKAEKMVAEARQEGPVPVVPAPQSLRPNESEVYAVLVDGTPEILSRDGSTTVPFVLPPVLPESQGGVAVSSVETIVGGSGEKRVASLTADNPDLAGHQALGHSSEIEVAPRGIADVIDLAQRRLGLANEEPVSLGETRRGSINESPHAFHRRGERSLEVAVSDQLNQRDVERPDADSNPFAFAAAATQSGGNTSGRDIRSETAAVRNAEYRLHTVSHSGDKGSDSNHPGRDENHAIEELYANRVEPSKSEIVNADFEEIYPTHDDYKLPDTVIAV